MRIDVYSFVDDDDDDVGSFVTQDIKEARAYACDNGYAIVANIYVWNDSELIEDYRPTVDNPSDEE